MARHGTAARYAGRNTKCRCDKCKRAWSAAMKRYRRTGTTRREGVIGGAATQEAVRVRGPKVQRAQV